MNNGRFIALKHTVPVAADYTCLWERLPTIQAHLIPGTQFITSLSEKRGQNNKPLITLSSVNFGQLPTFLPTGKLQPTTSELSD